MISRYRKLLFILLIPLVLTGCWDSNDINKRTITFSSGIDALDDYVLFFGEAAKIRSGVTGSNEMIKTNGIFIYDAIGRNLEEARGDFNKKSTAQNFAGAIRTLVLGKRYAEKGITPYINRTYFISEFRSSVLVVISKEPLKELFSKPVENDASVGYAIEDTIKSLSNNGDALYKTIQEVQSDIMFQDIGFLLPYVTNEGHYIKYLGLVAMKDSKIAGIINSNESKGYMYIMCPKISSSSSINLNDGGNPLSIKTTLLKRKIKTNYEDRRINIYIDLKVATQLDYEYKIEPLSKEDLKKVEKSVCSKIKNEITLAVNRSQNEFQCDVFGFARYFKAKNLREYRNINWKEEYPKAVVHVNVETTPIKTNLFDPHAK